MIDRILHVIINNSNYCYVVIVTNISLFMHNALLKSGTFSGKLFRVGSLDHKQQKYILVKSKKFLYKYL